MTTIKYKYDVAFSFLQNDEDLAFKINEMIKDRLQTFIYSEKQMDIAGKDGEKSFTDVFKMESRFVFVLYRKGWGETPWTRIEETAIRDRAYEEGYDFVLFAALDKPPETPIWLPRNRIWIGIERWGTEGAASVIEARVQEMGGEPKEITAADHAVRLSRDIKFENYKRAFLGSEKGVKAANEEIINMFKELDSALEKTKIDTPDILFERSNNKYIINLGSYGLLVHWSQAYANTTSSTALYVYIFDGSISMHGNHYGARPKRLEETEYSFDVGRNDSKGWRHKYTPDIFYSTTDIVKLCITKIMAIVLESKKRKQY